MTRARWTTAIAALALLAVAGCTAPRAASSPEKMPPMPGMDTPSSDIPSSAVQLPAGSPLSDAPLPGMPPVLVPGDIYAADRPNAFSPAVVGDLARVYVPNHTGNTVSVLDPKTARVLRTVAVPAGPEHVVPSYDLKTLWVNSDSGNALTPIDARTGTFGKPIAVNDPYNLYFTPDGRFAIVMAGSES